MDTRRRKAIRYKMWRKSKRCYYCGKRLAFDESTIDHVRPLSRGGYDRAKNMVVACNDCNQAKGSKMLYEYEPNRKANRQAAGKGRPAKENQLEDK